MHCVSGTMGLETVHLCLAQPSPLTRITSPPQEHNATAYYDPCEATGLQPMNRSLVQSLTQGVRGTTKSPFSLSRLAEKEVSSMRLAD